MVSSYPLWSVWVAVWVCVQRYMKAHAPYYCGACNRWVANNFGIGRLGKRPSFPPFDILRFDDRDARFRLQGLSKPNNRSGKKKKKKKNNETDITGIFVDRVQDGRARLGTAATNALTFFNSYDL